MKLWVLWSTENNGPIYDCMEGAVVRAVDEATARELFSHHAGDEGSEVWLDANRSSCEELKVKGEEGIILSSFHAG